MTVSPAGSDGATFRLLVVAYYFPPAGGAGVQRVLKWVKYLPEHGIAPTVLTVRAGAYPELDPSLGAEVPAGVEVVRTRAVDPFGVYARLAGRGRAEAVAARTDDVGASRAPAERAARWLRANVVLPDARVGWVPFAVAAGLRRHRRRPFDALLTSGPPHSVHLSGLALHRLAGLPWLADFRDPWTDIHYYESLPRTRLAARVDGALERRVLERADAVTTVSPSWAALLAERASRDVAVIHNGFDPADFAVQPPARPSGVFTVAHVGSLYDARDPVAFWQAAGSLVRDGARLAVHVVGRVGEGVRASAARHGVPATWEPYAPHAQAIDAMRAADMLLLSTEPHASERGHLTGKIYEYLAAGRPVLGLGAPAGDAAALLAETGGGRIFGRAETDAVRTYLRACYDVWADGNPLVGAPAAAVAPYSRRRQTARLARCLREIASRAAER